MSHFAIAWEKAVITPKAPSWPSLWMTGYGWGKRENHGTTDRDLYAQCIVIHDNGTPNVLLRVDVLGLPRDVHQAIRQRVVGEGLVASSDFLIAASHTHSGPYIGDTHPDPSILLGLEPAEIDAVNKSTDLFVELLVDLVRTAVNAPPVPATLSYAEGEVEIGYNRAGLCYVLKNVPVLLARDPASDAPLAVLFGYSCHPVSRGNDDVFDSDYCGYASEAIRDRLGIPAFFFQGAAGDQNPIMISPESVAALGEQLAQAVIDVIETGTFTPVTGPIVTELVEIELPFAVDVRNPSVVAELEAKYQARIDDPDLSAAIRRHAEVMLQQIRGDGLPPGIPMPIQRWRFDGLTLLALAHEVLSGYQIELKRLTSKPLWLMAYANETQCYVPTDQSLWASGYEAGWNDDPRITGKDTAMMSYTWPAPLASSPKDTRPAAPGSVERIVIDACRQLLGVKVQPLAACVETMVELRALSAGVAACLTLLGYYRAGDGGGGSFYWDAAATENDNGGTIIVPNAKPPKGRWKRLVESPLSVKWFGATGKGDMKVVSDGAINMGTATLSSATARFTVDDIGKTIMIEGAGIDGAVLQTTITAWMSPTQITLQTAAARTVPSSAVPTPRVTWGTDDAPSIQKALDVASDINSEIGTVHFPGGSYLLMNTLHVNGGVRLQGEGNRGMGNWALLKFAPANESAPCIDCDFSPNPAGGFEISDMIFGKATGTGGDAIYIHTVVVDGKLKQPSNIVLHNILVDSYDPAAKNPPRFARGLHIDGGLANEPGHRGVRSVYLSKVRVANCSTPEYIRITQCTGVVSSMIQVDRGADSASFPKIIVEGGYGDHGETAYVVLSGLIATSGDLVLRNHVRNFKAVGFVAGNISIEGTCTKVDLLANCDGKLMIETGATGSATGTFSGGVANSSDRFIVRDSAQGRPAVSGSKAGNVALANLISRLHELGIITDNTV